MTICIHAQGTGSYSPVSATDSSTVPDAQYDGSSAAAATRQHSEYIYALHYISALHHTSHTRQMYTRLIFELGPPQLSVRTEIGILDPPLSLGCFCDVLTRDMADMLPALPTT